MPLERSLLPKEHLLHVYMGRGRLLLPNTLEYQQYNGLQTGALASCTGIAIYIPYGSEPILGIGHVAPSQEASSLMEQFREQLREAGIDFHRFQQSQGYIELIPGQTTYDKEKGHLREKISHMQDYLKEKFPKLSAFPNQAVSYSVLRGHLSSSIRLLKSGNLIILGEGKAY